MRGSWVRTPFRPPNVLSRLAPGKVLVPKDQKSVIDDTLCPSYYWVVRCFSILFLSAACLFGSDQSINVVLGIDSLTSGYVGQGPYSKYLNLPSNYQVTNVAVPGLTLADALAKVDYYCSFVKVGQPNVFVLWGGTNSALIESAPAAMAEYQKLSQALQACSYSVIAVEMVSRNDHDFIEPWKAQFNVMLRELWPTMARAELALGMDPNVGCYQCANSQSLFYWDKIHLLELPTGRDIIAPQIAAKILALGNDFPVKTQPSTSKTFRP